MIRPVLLVLLLAAGCASGPAQKPDAASTPTTTANKPRGPEVEPARYYPLAVGNAWTYEVTTGPKTRRETVRIIGKDGSWFLDDHRARLRADSGGVRDADRYLLQKPLATGAKWTAVQDLVVQRFEVLTTEAITSVPAGRFEHCVVVRNDQALPGGANAGRFVTEWTYAPGVGLVEVRTATQQGGHETEQIHMALVEFKAGK